MKTFLNSLFICLLWGSRMLSASSDAHEEVTQHIPEFVIVIPSYNNETWAIENLQSACNQKSSKPYQIIYINDCSTDNTGQIIEDYVKQNNLESLVTIIHNTQRLGAMANWYHAIHTYVPDHKIVVNLDGDDAFAHDHVLLKLEEYYKDPTIWMTYGSARRMSNGKRWKVTRHIPKKVLRRKKIRKYRFVMQHLRTFRAYVFKQIKKKDMMYQDKFVDTACDLAFMIPIAEMCSPDEGSEKNHWLYIRELLYLYRDTNPISDGRVDRKHQRAIGKIIRSRKPYEPLKNCPLSDQDKE